MVRLKYSIKSTTPLLQFLGRLKTSVLEQPSDQNTEPNFNLVKPGSVLGNVDKTDSMARVR